MERPRTEAYQSRNEASILKGVTDLVYHVESPTHARSIDDAANDTCDLAQNCSKQSREAISDKVSIFTGIKICFEL